MTKTAPIILFLGGLGAIVVVGLIFRWLVRTSRSPTGPERIVALLLALLVIETSLYQNPDLVPSGLFHAKAGPLSFRIFDVLVPLAIIARFVAQPPARRSPVQVSLWVAFLVWILAEGILGVMGGNPKDAVTYEAKLIIYLGMFVLVAAVPARRWLESRALRRVIVMSSVLAAFLLIASGAHLSINLNLPLVPLVEFGVLGTDAATIFATLGIITLAVGMCSDADRLRALVVALPMLGAPLACGQRAAIIGLGTGVFALVVAAPFALRHIRVTGSEIGIVLVASAGIVTALLVLDAVTGSSHVSLPLAQHIQETFESRGKQLSGEDRINQWAQARPLIASRPWFGWGLGKEYDYYDAGFHEFTSTDLTHNIALDLLLRTGVVGLLLFLAAAVTSARDSIVTWLHEVDARIAALALGCAAAFTGLIVKGMFESIFEKYRLALLMGGLIGMSISFAAARLEASASEREARFLEADVLRGMVRR
jgi:O-antigen ligase